MVKSEQIVGLLQRVEKYRNEIIKAAALIFCTSLLIYYKSSYIVTILEKPLKDQPLFFLTPVDGIMVRIRIAFIGGLIISAPILAYRLISLLSFRISKKTRRIAFFFILPFAIIAFSGGTIFAYKLVVPATIKFLLSCGNEFMKPTISGSDYFSFVTILMIAIGIIFELPLILVALSKVGIVTYKLLSQKRKVAILIIFIVVALVTPTPDAFTLIVVAIPMVVLFEISIWWIFLIEKRNKKLESC